LETSQVHVTNFVGRIYSLSF